MHSFQAIVIMIFKRWFIVLVSPMCILDISAHYCLNILLMFMVSIMLLKISLWSVLCNMLNIADTITGTAR